MNCTKCGAPLPDNGRFCEKCGAPAPTAAPTGGVGGNPAPGGFQTSAPVPAQTPAPAATPTAQTASIRLYVKAALAIALICFLLPFVTVSCTADKDMKETKTGIGLLFATDVEVETGYSTEERDGKFNPYLWAAFGFTIAALVVAVKKKEKLPYILSGLGALAMLIFRFSFASFYGLDAMKDTFKIDFWFIGFYLSLLMMIGATVGQWFAEAQEKLPANAGANFGGGAPQPAPINIPVSQMGGQPNNNASNPTQSTENQSSGINLNK